MGDAAKQRLTVTEIRTRYITPAISLAGWPLDQTREEVFYFSAGRIQVMGQHGVRRKPKKVDYAAHRRPYGDPSQRLTSGSAVVA